MSPQSPHGPYKPYQPEGRRKTGFQYAAIVAGMVLAIQFGMHDVTFSKMAVNAYNDLAALAALSAGVQPNPENTMARQLAQKDIELTAREQMLVEKESEFDRKYGEAIAANRRLTLYVLGGITVGLLVLISLNFYFDIKREEEHEKQETETETHGGLTTKL